jgi:flagellar motor switch/type III secretory pathway protein FliN
MGAEKEMAMAAVASPGRVVEKSPGHLAEEPGSAAPNSGAGGGSETDIEEDGQWRPVLGLPCEFIVDLPVPGFKIADLLKVRTGSVINARWRVGHDVPLRLNGALIGWGEFEVMGNHLAVRLTELA